MKLRGTIGAVVDLPIATALFQARPFSLRGRAGLAKPATMNICFNLNGQSCTVNAPPERLLVELLRDQLGLSGTHIGCDTSQCGACNIMMDGVAIKSCTLLAVQAEGRSLTTIEGLATGDALHPMQAAFRDHHGLQCGFCTPGMVMAGLDIVRRRGTQLNAEEVARDLEGNICRCTGYQNIVAAIMEGARRMANA
jgi:aerobic carbon-monoxide dehydrogenase small subunit